MRMQTLRERGGPSCAPSVLFVEVRAAPKLGVRFAQHAHKLGSQVIARLLRRSADGSWQLSRVRARYQTTVSLQLDLNCTPAEPPDLMREKGKLSDANLRAVECFGYARFQSGLDD
jgi:hypothetical protein